MTTWTHHEFAVTVLELIIIISDQHMESFYVMTSSVSKT